MEVTQNFTHFPAGNFGKPVINAREQGEDRSWRDNIMEVRDDIISVMQMDIRCGQPQGKPGQPPDTEHRQKRQGKQHGNVKADRPAPERKKKTG